MEQALRVSFLLWAGGLCCFAGYWLRRWLVTATGVVGGLALGFALARFFGLPDWWQGTCLAAALGIALGILGFRLHKLGLFLFCGACAAALAYDLMTAYLTVWMEPWMLCGCGAGPSGGMGGVPLLPPGSHPEHCGLWRLSVGAHGILPTLRRRCGAVSGARHGADGGDCRRGFAIPGPQISGM